MVAWTCGKAVGILGTQECEQPVADFGVHSLPFAETSTKLIGFPSTAAQAMNCLAGLLYRSITTQVHANSSGASPLEWVRDWGPRHLHAAEPVSIPHSNHCLNSSLLSSTGPGPLGKVLNQRFILVCALGKAFR